MSFGVGFILEGAFDIFKGVKALIKAEDISLKDYFINKGINLTLMALFAGTSALKETWNLAKNGF
jgi:hypothetical protein